MTAITKSKGIWARLLFHSISLKPQQNPIYFSRNLTSVSLFPTHFQHSPKPVSRFPWRPCARFFRDERHFYESEDIKERPVEKEEDDEREFFASERTVYDLLNEVEMEKQREKASKRSAGLAVVDDEDDEDYMGVGPLIEKLQKRKIKDVRFDYGFDEPTDSDSEEDDERFSEEAIKKQCDEFDRKFKKHEQLLKNFVDSKTADEAYKCMKEIDKFEQRHFQLRPEYRVIGELMNHLKEATGKDRFLLIQKLNRAVRLVEWKEAYDPNNPANYGIIQKDDVPYIEGSDKEEEKPTIPMIGMGEVSDEDIAEIKEKDDILMEKINAIDKKLEQKLAELECTFGKKGRILEEEIRDLAEERNELTEKNRRPLYRKGFDVRLIDVNRTCKVTKGGQVVRYTALLACGNYHGVIGYAKGKGPAVPIALQKAYEKCFQNLHYVERYEEHTIAHAIQTKYKRTKVYLWPAPTRTGMKAGRTVENILHLAGFKNVKSKVIGSRNPHNTVKAIFKALNAIETPKDVQEKFGRTVVDVSLL